MRGKVSGNLRAKSQICDCLKVQVGGKYGFRKRRGGTSTSDAMYSLQLSTTLTDSMRVRFARSRILRTIRRFAITLVVVYKHAGFGTWVPRPTRVENIFVFVLPEYHSWMESFCNFDDDFVPLGGARERMRTECDCSTDRRHGVNSLHHGVPPEHPGNPRREPIDVHGSTFCRVWMHAKWLCYNEIRRIV